MVAGDRSAKDKAMLKVVGSEGTCPCVVAGWNGDMVELEVENGGPEALTAGTPVAIIRGAGDQVHVFSGTVETSVGGRATVRLTPAAVPGGKKSDNLANCQLPAMIRHKSEGGHYGCWKAALIVNHGPDRLVLQVSDGQSVPEQAELLFSPIGGESGSSGGRMYGDDGSVISASDVRSRRIRVRAVTVDVVASEQPGTFRLVMDVARALYRSA